MSELTAKHERRKTPREVCNVSVSFLGKLDSGETLSGTPTVSATPSGLTLGSPQRNGSTITVDDETCLQNQAVQFTVSAGSDNTKYKIVVQCGTSGSQTREVICTLIVAES